MEKTNRLFKKKTQSLSSEKIKVNSKENVGIYTQIIERYNNQHVAIFQSIESFTIHSK